MKRTSTFLVLAIGALSSHALLQFQRLEERAGSLQAGQPASERVGGRGLLRFLDNGQHVEVEGECGCVRVRVLSEKTAGPLDAEVVEIGEEFVVVKCRIVEHGTGDDGVETITYVPAHRIIAADAVKEVVVEEPELAKQRDQAEKRILELFEEQDDFEEQ